jgi:hypothetical protein
MACGNTGPYMNQCKWDVPTTCLHVLEAPGTGLEVVHHELPCIPSNVATTTQMILDDNSTLA